MRKLAVIAVVVAGTWTPSCAAPPAPVYQNLGGEVSAARALADTTESLNRSEKYLDAVWWHFFPLSIGNDDHARGAEVIAGLRADLGTLQHEPPWSTPEDSPPPELEANQLRSIATLLEHAAGTIAEFTGAVAMPTGESATAMRDELLDKTATACAETEVLLLSSLEQFESNPRPSDQQACDFARATLQSLRDIPRADPATAPLNEVRVEWASVRMLQTIAIHHDTLHRMRLLARDQPAFAVDCGIRIDRMLRRSDTVVELVEESMAKTR